MTQFLDFNLKEAYAQIKELAEAEPVTTNGAWDEMVDNFIFDKIGMGEIDSDNDTEAMITKLKDMWPEYKKNLSIR